MHVSPRRATIRNVLSATISNLRRKTSGASSFDKSTGWPHNSASDDDPLFELENASKDSYTIREVSHGEMFCA